jgi:hypothetical protein
MIVHFRLPDQPKDVVVLDVDIIPESGSKVCIPIKLGKERRVFAVGDVCYDYQPVTGHGIKGMYVCIVIINLL